MTNAKLIKENVQAYIKLAYAYEVVVQKTVFQVIKEFVLETFREKTYFYHKEQANFMRNINQNRFDSLSK
jgi:hypothetical protein